MNIGNNWPKEQIAAIYNTLLLELVYQAATMHRKYQDTAEVQVCTLPIHPESVPISALVSIKGTPLQDNPRADVWGMVRMIATARVIMAKTIVPLSAGRAETSNAEQALCFMAGANSIFAGDKL
jgi:biotin synthase-like enzyme